MSEDNNIIERIVTWGHAMQAVENNAELLIEDHMKNGPECARRMKVLDAAENEMLGLSHRSDLPAPLMRYIRAKDDSACATCWTSSHGTVHDECEAKIDEYFAARLRLKVFALSHSY